MWDDQWIPLTRDCRLVRYDLRGFGRSTMPAAPYSHADDLHALLNALRDRVGRAGGRLDGG